MKIDYSLLPNPHRERMRLYVEEGLHPGTFLYSVLCNSLSDTFRAASDLDRREMSSVVKFLDQLPIVFWGKQEVVEAWIKECDEERGKKVYRMTDGSKVYRVRGDKRNVISGDLLCDVEWLLKEVELFTKGKK